MSLESITRLVDDKIRSTALGVKLADPEVRDRAIEQAVLQYGLDLPRKVSELVTNVTGSVFDAPAGWIAGESQLEAVEFPVGQAPRATLEAAPVLRLDDTWGIMLAGGVSLAADTVRVHYSLGHVATAEECTVPPRDENAVACWAAAELCRQLATQKGHERDATIAAAAVNQASQSGDLARRAKDWFAQYRQQLGLPDPERTSGPDAAGAVTQFRTDRPRPRFRTLQA